MLCSAVRCGGALCYAALYGVVLIVMVFSEPNAGLRQASSMFVLSSRMSMHTYPCIQVCISEVEGG